MNNAYRATIHDEEYICITPIAHHDKRLFKIAMAYKKPMFKDANDNKLFFDECKSVNEPYKIIGHLELITEWDEKYGIDYREFHSINYLYFKAVLDEESKP